MVFLKIHGVRLHPVNPNIAVVRSNSNRDDRNLCKAIRGFVKLNSSRDSIKPQDHLSEMRRRQDVELKLHEVIFAVRSLNRVLLRVQDRVLSIHLKPNAIGHTAQHLSVVVANIICAVNKLEVLTASLSLISKQRDIKRDSRTGFDAEVSVSIGVELIAAVRPVEVIANCHVVGAISPNPILVCVVASCWAEVKN